MKRVNIFRNIFFISTAALLVCVAVFLLHCKTVAKIGLDKEPLIDVQKGNAVFGIPILDHFEPDRKMPLSLEPLNPDGAFSIAQPGAYVMECRAYCLDIHSSGPGSSDGYLLAPLKGTRSSVIRNLLRRAAVEHPEIPQNDIQILIWSILSKTKYQDLSPELRATARLLLSPEDLKSMDKFGLAAISSALFERLIDHLPEGAQEILRFEAQVRDAITDTQRDYADLENLILNSAQAAGADIDQPVGRWSFASEGYYVRYLPHSYRTMRLDVVFPSKWSITRDDKGRIQGLKGENGDTVAVVYKKNGGIEPVAADGALTANVLEQLHMTTRSGMEKMTCKSRWALSGTAGAAPAPAVLTNTAYPNLKDRIRAYADFLEWLAKREQNVPTDAAFRADVIDLFHLIAALEAPGKESNTAVADKALQDIRDAWMYYFFKWSKGADWAQAQDPSAAGSLPAQSGGPSAAPDDMEGYTAGSRKFDPTAAGAAPLSGGKQPLASSATPSDKEKACRDAFNKCDDAASEAGADCLFKCDEKYTDNALECDDKKLLECARQDYLEGVPPSHCIAQFCEFDINKPANIAFHQCKEDCLGGYKKQRSSCVDKFSKCMGW